MTETKWKEYRLLEIADIFDEKRIPLSKMEREPRHGKFAYYGASGIIDNVDDYLFDGEYVLISEDGENLKTRQTPIAFKASGKFWVNNHAHIVKSKKDYISDLIVYCLKNTDLHPFLTGAVQPKLNQENLLTIPFYLPEDETEQRAIASVLSSLDDKIDLLHRQNKTLETMAETLFRQWFVEKSDEGWAQGQISDLIEFNPTRSMPKGSIAPYLEMSNVSTSVFHPENWYDREFSSGMKFKNGDTLIARITPCLENGKSAYITFLKEGQIGWGSTEYIVLCSKETLHPLFTYALAKNKDFRDYAEGSLEGSSGRQRVNIDHLVDFEITMPPKHVIDTFNSIMKGLEPKLHNNFLEMCILECADGSYYTGSTKNLEKRLWEHDNFQGANYTRKKHPSKLVYVEEYNRIDEAFYREKQVQGWSHAKKKALIEKNPNSLHELAICKNESHFGNATIDSSSVASAPLSHRSNESRLLNSIPDCNSNRLLSEESKVLSKRSLSGVETTPSHPVTTIPQGNS